MIDELKKLRDKADAGKFKTWTLGGSNGRGITTPSGYYGDGFLADTDTKANAEYIAALHNANLIDRVEELERVNKVSKVVVDAWETSEKELLKKIEHLSESRDRWKKACGNNLKDAYDNLS